jgi:type VI secretion system protein ImpA
MTRNRRTGGRDEPAPPPSCARADPSEPILAEAADVPDALRAWLLPLPGDCPAGPCLEYTTEYAALQARMAAPVEVQYGQFTQRREAPPWRELERECQALLQRSRDITVLVWWLRCRVHNAGALGLAQGLRGMVLVLRAFGEHVHPQALVDGEPDPAMRANALALLCDGEGLLADVRDLVALRAQGEQRRVREIERGLAHSAGSRQALQDLLARSWFDGDPERRALGAARDAFTRLLAWVREDLQHAAPDLGALEALLEPLAAPPGPGADARAGAAVAPGPPVTTTVRELPDEPRPCTEAGPASTPLAQWEAGDRAAAQAGIAQARAWFERYEPSSPVAVLLRQAERLVGKRYAEVVQAIPGELLARWESG